ncbi:MAG: hypothetical protein H7346_09315 [Burkholderiaceae bacterium]|nr:hypothetical protein [Burkholderiaceae bacterium]
MTQPKGSAAASLADKAQIAILEAQAAIDAHQRLVHESGLTPQACIDAVRHSGGEAAVAMVRQEVGRTLRALDEKMERDVMHRPAANRPLSRRLVNRGV